MKYTVLIHRDVEDGGYWGECPELPGCYSQAESVEELMRNMREAVELYAEPLRFAALSTSPCQGRQVAPVKGRCPTCRTEGLLSFK